MTRVGVVDLGSNSTRLLIADMDAGRLDELDRQITITRLGEAVDAEGLLQPNAIERVNRILEKFLTRIDEQKVDHRIAVATSAVRDARNGRAFLDGIERHFGIRTLLLSGDREAELAFCGATLGREQDPTLLVDVGGGSTEYVLGSTRTVGFSCSIDLGCVRLTERFLESDPPTPQELRSCRDHIGEILSEKIPSSVQATSAVGVAGTATTMAMLSLGLEKEVTDVVHGHYLATDWLATEVARLSTSTVSELRARRGIHPDRGPVIVAGAIVLFETLRHFALDGIEVSETDLLHGVALKVAEES